MSGISTAELARMVTALEMSGRLQVLQRLAPVSQFAPDVPRGAELRRAMVLDIRCTGLVAGRDRIYELAYIVLEYDRLSGRGVRVSGRYRGIEDVGGRVAPEDLAAAGLSAKDLRGASFDDERVVADLAKVDLVISHNFGRDRRLLEARFEGFATKWFACSQVDVPWREFGVSCTEPQFLAMRLLKAYYEAGSAMGDAEALCQALCHVTDKGVTPLLRLIESSRAPRYRVWLRSDGDRTDMLKSMGYRVAQLDGNPSLVKEVASVETETSVLLAAGINVGPEVVVDLVTGRERFSNRRAKREMLALAGAGEVTR